MLSLNQVYLLIPIILLCGCNTLQTDTMKGVQVVYEGRSISDVETKLGRVTSVTKSGENINYSWKKEDTRWVTIAPSQSITGTQFIKGRNVATIVKSLPIRTLQNVSCSVNVLTNSAGKIISLSEKSFGLNCDDLLSKL